MPKRVLMILAGLGAIAVGAGCHPSRERTAIKSSTAAPIRAIWVTRWDYKTPADIASVMENCRRAGFNTVLFQVRGNGTAFYRSTIEPWADELGGRDPGFDPLALACTEAHRRGLSLHAWVNVMPGWRGDKPPANPRQLYRSRPAWFWRDASGRRQPLGWYNSLNPCYPEVRRYLVQVMQEIVKNYPVDGLHMDYVRFPNEWHKSYLPGRRVPDYPRDPRTLAMFRRATGQAPESSPRLWDAWRTEQVTQLVRDIRAMISRVKPAALLSAAVGASPEEAKRRHFQDSRRWMAEGLLDAVYPMNYAGEITIFVKRLNAWSAMKTGVPVVMGVMFDNRDWSTVIEQINRSLRYRPHFAAFAYNSLFERSIGKARHGTDGKSAARAALRNRVIPYLRNLTALRV